MLKVFATFLLLFVFAASTIDLGCGIELDSGTEADCSCFAAAQGHCSDSDQNSNESESNHHCAGCVHISLIEVNPAAIGYLKINGQIYSQYFYLYNNPTFDSLKRPPLAA